MKIAVIFDNLGPYHVARLESLSALCDLTAIELYETSSEYAWQRTQEPSFERAVLSARTARALRAQLKYTLDKVRPDVVFVPGWSTSAALTALAWALKAKVPAILMSDSLGECATGKRPQHKEYIKEKILRCFSGALVAGSPHQEYIEALGLKREFSRIGYDVVDNNHFASGARWARMNEDTIRTERKLPQRYVLAPARFIAEKNLPTLIRAFAKYRQRLHLEYPQVPPWDLVLLGDGPMREELEDLIENLDMAASVQMVGFRQYDELPSYYGLAKASILASSSETWGLVINESMASGLPVLVSKNCGCAADLVIDGVNGRTFKFDSEDEISSLLLCLTVAPERDLADMGAASIAHISSYSPQLFADGAMELAQSSRSLPNTPRKQLSSLLLWILSRIRGRT